MSRAIQFSSAIPMRSSANAGWAANRRHAAAMFVYPAHRNRPMTVLRKAAITCGIFPHRTWDRSSSQVTSRTPWDGLSLCQWSRTSANSCTACACSDARLVTPTTTSSRTVPVFLLLPCRSRGNTCAKPGQSLLPHQHVPGLPPAWLEAAMPTLDRLCHRPEFPCNRREGKDSGNVFP